MLRRHLPVARGHGIGVYADRGLEQWRAVEVEEDGLAQRLLRVAPVIQRVHDLLRHLFLKYQEWIVL
ncbi:hypothetical protein ACVIU4_005180 [Bradyrhizobium barranii subsp. barranii]